MNEYKENMFELPIYCINIKNWDSKKNLLKNLIEKSNILIKKGETVQSDYEDNGPFNQEIYKIVKEEIEEFCTLSKLYCQKLSRSWFQISSKGQYHPIHNHGAIGYSATCFVEYDNNYHTPTQFIAPYADPITGNVIRYSPKVEEGVIIFFPSMIPHFTEPNLSNVQRTILSFNLDVEYNDQLNQLFNFIDNLDQIIKDINI
jgi:hypothetical protein